MAYAKGISLDAIIEAWKRNGHSARAAARDLGCHNTVVLRRLRAAGLNGDTRVDMDALRSKAPITPESDEVTRARIELSLRHERKAAKGSWRKPSYINLGTGPIILGVFGDPHIDNSGTDLDLFEDALSKRDPDGRVFTCCVGDFFDNWPRVMGHLYQESGDPTPAWRLFEHWMDNWPFLFSVSGNHGQFASGTVNFLDEFMRQRGMLMRRSGGRFILDLGGDKPVTISMRHIWQGSSQYSDAHALKRAATFGHTDDDAVIGGHIHRGELRFHIRPSDGKVSRLIQVSSFKKNDTYANDRGFMSAETPPVVWLVIDDREPVTSHNRVQPFYDFSAAKAMHRHQMEKNDFG